MMKPSVYNLTVDQTADGDTLLFNTATTAFCILEPAMLSLVNEPDRFDEAEAEEDIKENFNKLKDMGFIVDDDFDERGLILFQQNVSRFHNDTLGLTLGPTMNCNMRCPYCFEPERYIAMTDEMVEKVICFAKNYVKENDLKGINITWYGGEPLLEFDTIVKISKDLIQYCDENKLHYGAGIITNGYLLDYNKAAVLKDECRVSFVQITIDGLEETHNQRRKLKNGKGSFRQIIENIDAAKDLVEISVRVNVDENNIDEIAALTDFFIEEKKWTGNPNFYLAPVEKFTENVGTAATECILPEDFSKLLQENTLKVYEQGNKDIADWRYPRVRVSGCAALGMHSFVIDSEGYFYPCWNYFGTTEKNIGHIDHPEKLYTNQHHLKWLNLPVPEKCAACIYLPLCQSGCPDRRISNGNSPICDYRTLLYINDLKLAYRHYLDKKAKQETDVS